MSTKKKIKDPLAQRINHLLGEILDGNHEETLQAFAGQSSKQHDAYRWLCGFIAAKPKKRHAYGLMREYLVILINTKVGGFTSNSPFIDGSLEKLDKPSQEIALEILQAFKK